MDSGQDETHNPFSNVSDEYVAQKEEAIAKKQFKRISAQQRQINKVRWAVVFLVFHNFTCSKSRNILLQVVETNVS